MSLSERVVGYVSKSDKKKLVKSAKAHGLSVSAFLSLLVRTHLAEDRAFVAQASEPRAD